MAYTNVPTVSVGDLYTADNFNTYLRDNFGAGIPDKFTAKGDIAFGEGADTIGILALGNAGDWLTADAGETLGVKWAAPTGFFDWFTFGAFTCATLDDVELPKLGGGFTITDIPTCFGIADTTARLFLTSLSVRRNGEGANSYSPADEVLLWNGDTHYNDRESFLGARALGDSSSSTSWYWNTQTGFMRSDSEGDVRGYYIYNIGFNITIKIWGYA